MTFSLIAGTKEYRSFNEELMMRYPKEYVEDLCSRADIVEVVRSFMKLKTRGATNDEHVAHCPFHVEKTPSFVVHSEKQIYHCFGCGRHGGVIKFLKEHQKMSFLEAVHWLAKRYHFYLKQWPAWKKKREQEDANWEEENQ